MAIVGATGLVVAAVAAGITAVVGRASDVWDALLAAAWIIDAVLAGVATVYLVITVVPWGVYRRRRAELDAAGAEAMGEFQARSTLSHHDDPD
ncbi:hypothetical protein UG55_111130 [Frankia sp. EI5c]|uniref:hypothetical protein n=1 Tax=Frankia sp. EI5c TaxID=683316 RepID=UPI0007C22A24|nr:hypothetical protein [Frankia sp. EI5c]OAA18462.1 hypothetical protein UG55_111130 [Frankia sp. EI5c]